MSFFRTIRSQERFAGGYAGEILLERFDYDGSGNLVYHGACNQAQGSSSEEIWVLAKLTYDGSNRLVRTEYRFTAAWDERAIQDWLP